MNISFNAESGSIKQQQKPDISSRLFDPAITIAALVETEKQLRRFAHKSSLEDISINYLTHFVPWCHQGL